MTFIGNAANTPTRRMAAMSVRRLARRSLKGVKKSRQCIDRTGARDGFLPWKIHFGIA